MDPVTGPDLEHFSPSSSPSEATTVATSAAVSHHLTMAIKIRLGHGHGLRLSIADDGSGFDPDRVGNGRLGNRRPGAGGFGLASTRDRTEQLGGSLRVRSRAGGGTKVEVALP